MIEAKCAWTLEGPDDSITFDSSDVGTPWTLTAKPRTVVDDRREVYDYPLDDGGYVGDAYAGTRAWSLSAALTASSHTERNTELQRLNALLNSLRRSDGLLKWDPAGFPAVQSTVRRMGSADYSGGRGLYVPVTFGLLSGDPRVYSQVEHSEVVAPTTETLGTSLLTANQASLETNTSGWVAGAGTTTITRSTTVAHAGSASLRLAANTSPVTALVAQTTSIAVSPSQTYRFSCWMRTAATGTTSGRLNVDGYLSGAFAGAFDLDFSNVSMSANTWYQITALIPVPSTGIDALVVQPWAYRPGSDFGATDYVYIDDAYLKPVTFSAAASIDNAGDESTAPTVVIDGPVTDPTISNVTASSSLPLVTSILGGHTLTVDASAREIYTGTALTEATNRYSAKSSGSSFVVLRPGTNELTFSGGSTDVSSSVEFLWRDAWMP